MQVLNAIWALLCLAGGAAVLYRWRDSQPTSWARSWARLAALCLLAGILLPAVSANDDAALWRQDVSQAGMSGPRHAGWGTPATASDPAPAGFWLQFSHLFTPGAPPAAPDPAPRDRIALAPQSLVRAVRLHSSDRGPPLFNLV